MTATGIKGTEYKLGKTPIGSGGEGDIYDITGMNYVAKIYKPGALSDELEQKLKIMINNPPSADVLSQVAWPIDMAYDDNDKCLGFIMPKLNIDIELGDIYKYPSVLPISAHQKLKIAQNICVVIAEVHKAGYVFGDFNPRNIGLNNKGLVSFLDTDTYHVTTYSKTYRCNVCAPGYAAPEILEKCADYIIVNPAASKNAYALTPLPTFTQQTDNFALAIHIFKLLMNGYTPFGGILDTASVSQSSPGVGDTAVRRDNYCFKQGYKHQSSAIMPLEVFPEEIGLLFARAFITGRTDPTQRPTAEEWYKALSDFEYNMVTCLDNPLHQYGSMNKQCPLCEADRLYMKAISPIEQSKTTPISPFGTQTINPYVQIPASKSPAKQIAAIIAAAAVLVFVILYIAIPTSQIIPAPPAVHMPPTPAPILQVTPTPTPEDTPTPTPQDTPTPTPQVTPTPTPQVTPAPTPPPLILPAFPGRLDRTMSGREIDEVRTLQNAINDISRFYTGVRRITLVNGHFGGNTTAAIFEFQHRTGLPRTGIVDSATWYLIMERQAVPPEVSDPPYTPRINAEYVVMSPLNLRSGPSGDHSIVVRSVAVDSIVFATHYMGSGWLRVTFGNHSGYMYREFLLLRSIML